MAVTWPITKTGTYASGSVAAASDFSSDFTTLYDAVNQVHNRFSTALIDATYNRRIPASSSGFASLSNGTIPQLIKIFKVPDWMQGFRVRKLSVACLSVPYSPGTQVFSNNANGSLKFKVAKGTAISQFDKGDWGATDIASLDFTVSGANGSSTQDPLLGLESNAGYPTVLEATVTTNNVFVPGDYLAVTFLGGFLGTVSGAEWDAQFDISVECDAMVPVP